MQESFRHTKLSLVIPCFNEERRLSSSLPDLVVKFLDEEWELIVVDDGSSDNTSIVAEEHLRSLGPLGRVIKMKRHEGKGAAIRRGMLEAKGAFVFFTDCDLPYGLTAIEDGLRMIEEEDLDFIAGERTDTLRKGSILRLAASLLFKKATGIFFRLPVEDTQCGFKGLRAGTVKKLLPHIRADGFIFDVEMLLSAKKKELRIGSLPVSLENDNESKIRLIRHGSLMLIDMLALRFESWGLLHGKRNEHPLCPEDQGGKSLSAILLIALLAIAISLPLLQLGFFAGDTTNIEVASEHSFAKMLFTGSGIRHISRIHFTPMMGITLRMDWLFFGTDCFWYSLHNVLWLWLLGVSAYILMRTCGAGVMGSALAGAMLVLAPISVSISAWYSTRHYIGGLCWTILSLSSILEWNKGNKKWLYGAAVFCYALALLCKEVYFPLVLLSPLIIQTDRRRKLKVLAGYGAVALLYLVLRRSILKNVIAGYGGGSYDVSVMLRSLVESWPRLTETVIWGGGDAITAWIAVAVTNMIILVSLVMFFKRSRWKGILLYLMILFVSLFAVSFILGDPNIRYAERLDFCKNDRLNLAFSSSVLLCFAYLLFVPCAPNAENKNQNRLHRRKIIGFFLCLSLMPVLWAGASRNIETWSTRKYHTWQWKFIEENIDKQIVLTGVEAPSLQIFIRIASKYYNRVPCISARGYFEKEEDWRDLDYRKVYLMIPGKLPRLALSREEMMAWLSRYNTKPPSSGGVVRIRMR